MKISILLISNKRLPLLRECLKSIENTEKALPIEIVLGFNGDKKSFEIFNREVNQYEIPIRTKLVSTSPNGEARNKLIKECSGDYICFLDDDVTIPRNYFLNVEKIITSNLNLDIFGGPDLTPKNQTPFQNAIGHVIQSSFAMGPTFHRHKKCSENLKNSSETELILCNLIIKSNLFNKDNLKFHPTITRNEENILLAEAKDLDKNIGYTPNLVVFHQRKKNILKFVKAIFSSGFNRTRSCIILPNSFRAVYFAPLLFIFYLIGTFFIKNHIYLLPLYLYLLLLIFSTLIIFLRTLSFRIIIYSCILFILTHLTYGIGLLTGALSDKNWTE